MITRLLKMLSGLVPLWGRRAAAPRVRAVDDYSDLNDLLDSILSYAPIHVDRDNPQMVRYCICNKCSAFLTEGESSCFACTMCRSYSPPKSHTGSRPVRAYATLGGVVLSVNSDSGAADALVGTGIDVLLGATQSEALARMLLKPGSAAVRFGFDENESALLVGWDHVRGIADLTVHRADMEDEIVGLTGAQAERLGEDIAGCLGIPATALCGHRFVDARNKFVDAGEACVRCGAIRQGDSGDE